MGERGLGIPKQERPSLFYPYNQRTPLFIPVCPGAGRVWPPLLWVTAAGRRESHWWVCMC